MSFPSSLICRVFAPFFYNLLGVGCFLGTSWKYINTYRLKGYSKAAGFMYILP